MYVNPTGHQQKQFLIDDAKKLKNVAWVYVKLGIRNFSSLLLSCEFEQESENYFY